MSFCRLTLLGVAALLAAFAPTAARGQSSSESGIPVLASGQMPTAVPTNDFAPSNVFAASVTSGLRFDNNALLGAVPHRSDVAYTFRPAFAFDQTLRRVTWGLSYGPGVDISQQAFFPDQFTNDFGGHLTWLVSKHGMFAAQQNYIVSTDPFQQFGSQPYTTTPGPLVAPNQSIFIPNLHFTSFLSQAQYSYQLGPHTTLGVAGDFGLQHFSENSSFGNPGSQNSAVLIGSHTISAQAYLAHQLSARNQVGVEYAAQVMRFPIGNARTTTHSFLIFDDVTLTANSKVSLYGGPEYSLISNQLELGLGFLIITIPLKSDTWTWSGGAIYSWTRRRAAVVLNYSRTITNGGGLLGAVEFDGGSANFNWQLTKAWNVRMGLQAADNRLLGVHSGPNTLVSYSARISVSREIVKNTTMDLFFERLNQTGTILGLNVGNHDITGLSFQYSFRKPLGR